MIRLRKVPARHDEILSVAIAVVSSDDVYFIVFRRDRGALHFFVIMGKGHGWRPQMCWTRLVAGEACGRFAGLMEISAIYERPHTFCLWPADGQTNGVECHRRDSGQLGRCGGLDLLKLNNAHMRCRS